MGNIKNFNFNKLDMKLSNSDYWDMYLATDDATLDCTGVTSGDSFVVWYDFNKPDIYASSATSATSIYSLVTWNDATNTGYTMNSIGLTGLDNGLVTFDKLTGDTYNTALLSALTGTTLVVPSGDTRLNLHKVTGTTGNYIYPIDIISATTANTVGEYAQLCGGFYQGFYKLDGNSYEVLPTRVNQAWSAEFWINPQDICSTGYTGTTLNDLYPDNKGMFFYMGTRAENKFWNQYSGEDTGCTSACTATTACTDTISPWCTLPRETDLGLIGDYGVGIPLSPPQIEIDLITNEFLIYGRAKSEAPSRFTGDSGTIIPDSNVPRPATRPCNTCGGNHDGLGSKTVCDYDGKGIVVTKTASEISNTTNPFLVFGRASKTGGKCGCNACGGEDDDYGTEQVCTFSGFTTPQIELDHKADVIDNAFGLRIKDDGSIGYRLLTLTGECITSLSGKTYVSGVTVEEGYSISGMVTGDTWSYIAIRFVTDEEDDCSLDISYPRTGKLMFYVNAKLKYVVEDFPELVGRRLNEYKDKQVGVPFNMSLGGGSQGLIDSQTFDGLDMKDRGLDIETNFAGTFIGGVSQFKFNITDLKYCDIEYNYAMDAPRYGITILNYGNC